MTRTATKNFIICIAVLLMAVALAACGSGAGGGAPGSASGEPKNDGKPGDYKIPSFKTSVYHQDKAQGNGEASVDISSVSSGYIAVLVNSDAKVKVQVLKGKDTYTYDAPSGEPQIYPLQCGDGVYTIKVMKNVEGNSYYELYACQADVKLKNKFQPFIRPGQYADYTKKSDCVKLAREMAEQSSSESDFISKVYDYVCKNIKYDYDLASTVESGYIPAPDKILESGKGICFDYASLAASMLRSQGIPTKIIFGYVAPDDLYHAWNMFYTKKQGWVTVEFEAPAKKWSRLDLTFTANGNSDEFIGDGTNYEDVYQY